MSTDILFKERQRMTQWWFVWVWVVLIGVNGLCFYGVYKQVIAGQPFGNKPSGDMELILITGFILLVTIFLFSICLDTIVKKDGIYIRFFPFHLKVKYYSWDSLTKIYFREYAPIKEFGGWGLRYGGGGMAYTLSGNIGLQLEFKDNKKVLIGTKKKAELELLLGKMGHLKS